jgi:hypothetical protein
MPSNENAGQQLDSYLPGMAPPKAKQLKPHQMTPEQFSAHPYAVFRSTHLPEGQELDTSKSFLPGGGVHLGTEQAALDRHRATSFKPAYNEQYEDPRSNRNFNSDARMYTYWHKPTEEHLTNLGRDSEENDLAPGTRYYQNKYEDPGSHSLVTTETSRLKTHGDYVRKAIKSGKGHEVPSQTMEMYRQGALDKGAWLPRAHTTQYTERDSGGMEQDYARKNGGQVYESPIMITHKDPKGQPFDENNMRDFHQEHGWYAESNKEPVPRISENGPNIHRLREQLAKDTKKGA